MKRTTLLIGIVLVLVMQLSFSKSIHDVLTKLINKHSDVLIKSTKKHAPNIKIPDVEKKVSLGILGSIEAKMKNIKLVSLDIQKPTIGKGNTIKFKDSKIKLSLDWRVNIAGKKERGTAAVKLTFSTAIHFEIIPTSKLFKVKKTAVDITDSKINLKGGPATMQNALNGSFKKPVQDELKKHIEPALDDILTKKLNKLLTKYQDKVKASVSQAAI